MHLTRKRLILLHRIRVISRPLLRNMIKIDPSLESYFYLSPNELSNVLSIPESHATKMYHSIQFEKTNDQKIPLNKKIQIITIFDSEYPNYLKHIPDRPLVLYAIGNVKLLQKNPSISVVGTRKPTQEAYEKTKHILSPLIKRNWIIVSGLAYGIDRFAHEITVDQQGKTIAVLGSGFNHLYPKQHIPLAKKIVQHGLLISEYPPFVKPHKAHFPERNRIISGLSDATLVIEAMERSGTFITVDQALEQGKDVYAVPGSIFYPQTVGCHRLIQQGATLTTSAEDIIENSVNRYDEIG